MLRVESQSDMILVPLGYKFREETKTVTSKEAVVMGINTHTHIHVHTQTQTYRSLHTHKLKHTNPHTYILVHRQFPAAAKKECNRLYVLRIYFFNVRNKRNLTYWIF